MRAATRMGLATVALCASLLLHGCGVRISLTGPSVVGPGGQVPYSLALENPSACPVGDVEAIVVPFIRIPEIDVDGDPDLEDLFVEFLLALCTGQPFELPDGIICRIEGNEIICEVPDGQAPPGGPFTVSTSKGPMLECEGGSTSFRCSIASGALSSALATTAALQTLNCAQVGEVVECEAGQIDGGQTLSSNFSVTAPTAPGTYQTFVLAGADERGVCTSASSAAGAPCDSDADCPGGTMDDCASSVCVNDTTMAAGAGCEDSGDCAMGESCVACDANEELLLPIACQQITVGTPAPAMSPAGLAVSVLLLLALSAFALRRRVG